VNVSAPQFQAEVLSTMEADGRHRWITPKLAKGKFLFRRRVMAYALIALLTLLPLIPINGKPAVLLNVPDRQFTLLGYTFLPTDTVLLALLMVSWFATIFLTTAVVGRAWCGWACPQTVYMEFVYRPLERFLLGRRGVGGRPTKTGMAIWRRILMHLAFAAVSLVITHTLLSYFVGAAQLRHWMLSNPAEHPWAFGVIAVSTLAVWYNFVFFREQMCTVACPYGRFQSVLFDPHSLTVRYNNPRGEPRTKLSAKARTVVLPTCTDKPPGSDCDGCTKCTAAKFGSDAAAIPSGECIDCSMCVQVCPTGIDIRNGVQLECINCAQCIDACGSVMRKVGRSEGLIGYYAQVELDGQPRKTLRPRVMLYAFVSVGFLAAMLLLILLKSPFDATLARNIGLPFYKTPAGQIQNAMRLTLRNRTSRPQTFTLSAGTAGVRFVGDSTTFTVPPHESAVKPVNVIIDPAALGDGMIRGQFEIKNEDGAARVLQCQLYGPGGQP